MNQYVRGQYVTKKLCVLTNWKLPLALVVQNHNVTAAQHGKSM